MITVKYCVQIAILSPLAPHERHYHARDPSLPFELKNFSHFYQNAEVQCKSFHLIVFKFKSIHSVNITIFKLLTPPTRKFLYLTYYYCDYLIYDCRSRGRLTKEEYEFLHAITRQ